MRNRMSDFEIKRPLRNFYMKKIYCYFKWGYYKIVFGKSAESLRHKSKDCKMAIG